jgi:hypothetical protein
MALNVEKIALDMFNAAFPILKKRAPTIKAFAQGEFHKIAVQLVTIETELVRGRVSKEQASILMEMQKSATRSVLLTAKGLSLLVVEQAINAALGVVRKAVNTAVGIKLL